VDGTRFIIKEDVHTLGEVTAKASKLKMVMRGDTVVYNADLFQLAEGSMLDKLFQLMPGFEVKPGGAIYVNGNTWNRSWLTAKTSSAETLTWLSKTFLPTR